MFRILALFFISAIPCFANATTVTIYGITPSTGNAYCGATPVSRQTVSGSKAGNAALTSLMAALSALGLVLDTTS